MNVVALISGGKDSTYNMMECIRHGHKIVALVNLHPATSDVDELDSFCFQTVGHTVIEAYSVAMGGLPLYRQAINAGGSKNQDLAYEETDSDEVEDLYCVLLKVKRELPEVNAVSSGAVFSDYQRLRVEHICDRLQLTSLAYLWQRPQQSLLSSIIDSGIEAVLIKIAAMGLSPSNHLGRSLSDLKESLFDLENKYGCHAAGEGGEYETLTLDCPLFTHKLVLDDPRLVIVSPDKYAPVAHLNLPAGSFHLESKATLSVPNENSVVCDDGAAAAADATIALWTSWMNELAATEAPDWPSLTEETTSSKLPVEQMTIGGDGYSHACAAIHVSGYSNPLDTVEATAAAAMESICGQLNAAGFGCEDVFFSWVYLADLGDFSRFNKVYSSFFGFHRAPSRVCVGIGRRLPTDAAVLIECAAAKGVRRVLHVRSISAWCPSCIGPYSQASTLIPVDVSEDAVCVQPNLVHCAGQIALDPATMILRAEPPVQDEISSGCWGWREAIMCYESCSRVLRAQKSGPELTVGATLYVAKTVSWAAALRLRKLLIALLAADQSTSESPPDAGSRVSASAAVGIVAVDALPRAAAVELQLYAAELGATLSAAVEAIEVRSFCAQPAGSPTKELEPSPVHYMPTAVVVRSCGCAGRCAVLHVDIDSASASGIYGVSRPETSKTETLVLHDIVQSMIFAAAAVLERRYFPRKDTLKSSSCRLYCHHSLLSSVAGADFYVKTDIPQMQRVVCVPTVHREQPLSLHVIVAKAG